MLDMNRREEKTLGQILLEKNIISKAQLALALQLQKKEPGKYLGQILQEMGVPQDEINKALDYARKRKPLGEILIDSGVITHEQLSIALDKQRKLKHAGIYKPLGILLVEMGFTSYYEYLKALSKHFNMPIVNLKGFTISPLLQMAIGEKYAQKHRIIVLEDQNDKIKIALAEPNLFLMDEIRRSFFPRRIVEFYLASPSDIETCFKSHYDPFALNLYR